MMRTQPQAYRAKKKVREFYANAIAALLSSLSVVFYFAEIKPELGWGNLLMWIVVTAVTTILFVIGLMVCRNCILLDQQFNYITSFITGFICSGFVGLIINVKEQKGLVIGIIIVLLILLVIIGWLHNKVKRNN